MFMTFAKVVLLAAVMLYVPGYLLFRGLGLKRWQALATAPMVCLAGFEALAIAYAYLGIRCSLVTLFGPTLAACVLVWAVGALLRRRAGRRSAEGAEAAEMATGAAAETATGAGAAAAPEAQAGAPDALGTPAFGRRALIAEFTCAFTMSALLFVLFYRNGRYDMVQGGYDMTYHLNILRSMTETGVFSMLRISPYPLGSPLYQMPFMSNPGTFYPAAWHAVVASIMGVTSAPISLVINGVVFVFAGAVYGIGMGALLQVLFADDERIGAGTFAFASTLVAAFPWAPILLGNYPLVTASLGTLPLLVLGWLSLLRAFAQKRGRLAALFALLVCLFATVCVHTSVLFASAQFIVFATVGALLNAGRTGRLPERTARRAALGFALFALLVWVGMFNLPAVHKVVAYSYWQATKSWPRALADALLMKNVTIPQPQPVLAALMLAGFVQALRTPEKRWIAALRAFAVLMVATAWADEGLLNHLISGFWYVDPDRSCAIAGLFSMPCLVLGAQALAQAATWLVQLISHRRSEAIFAASGTVSLLAAAALALAPSSAAADGSYRATAFGYVRDVTRAQILPEYQAALRADEIEFGRKAQEITGAHDLVLNVPDDGSTTFYGLLNMNMYYRRNYLDHWAEQGQGVLLRMRLTRAGDVLAYGLVEPPLQGAASGAVQLYRALGSEPWRLAWHRRDEMTTIECAASRVLRLGLARYTEDAEVACVLRMTGARYLILLDIGPESDRGYFHTHKDYEWAGMLAVNESTPGFTEVLAEGDMRLYRIDMNW